MTQILRIPWPICQKLVFRSTWHSIIQAFKISGQLFFRTNQNNKPSGHPSQNRLRLKNSLSRKAERRQGQLVWLYYTTPSRKHPKRCDESVNFFHLTSHSESFHMRFLPNKNSFLWVSILLSMFVKRERNATYKETLNFGDFPHVGRLSWNFCRKYKIRQLSCPKSAQLFE